MPNITNSALKIFILHAYISVDYNYTVFLDSRLFTSYVLVVFKTV